MKFSMYLIHDSDNSYEATVEIEVMKNGGSVKMTLQHPERTIVLDGEEFEILFKLQQSIWRKEDV